MIDFKVVATRRTTVDEVNAAVKKAVRGRLKGVLDMTNEPLVSTDFNHNPASSTFDLQLLAACQCLAFAVSCRYHATIVAVF